MESRKGCQSQCKCIQRLYRQACLIFASKVALLYDVAIPELIVLRFGIVWRYYVKYSKFVQHAVGVTRHMLMIFLLFCFSGHWCWNTVNTCENHILCKCARMSQSLNGFSQSLVCIPSRNLDTLRWLCWFFKSQLICFFAMFQHFLTRHAYLAWPCVRFYTRPKFEMREIDGFSCFSCWTGSILHKYWEVSSL